MWWVESLRMRYARVAALVAAGCVASCSNGGPDDAASSGTPAARSPAALIVPAAQSAAAQIEAEYLRSVVAEIADDRYAGRSPGSEGDRMTRAYLARELERSGFAPGAANGGWEQTFELVSVEAAAPPLWTFTRAAGPIELARLEEYVAASGVQNVTAELADAELVFVGYGIEAPEHDWDDFKGADLSGKVLLMLNNDPDWDPALFAGVERLYYGRWTYKYESAARQGAVGAIIIHTTPSAGYPWQVVQSSWSGPQFELPATDAPRVQVEGWVTEDAARRLLAPAHDLDALVEQAKRRDFAPVALGIRTSLALTNTLNRTETANVIGVLPGSDPELADELVIYTAHHDHLGVGEPNAAGDANDRIYNGARDNASGVGIVLATAKAFAALEPRPRRSIVALFVGAEEQGLLGSEYFAAHPTVPAGKIAANVNYDSANIWGTTQDITFVGLGKSSLDGVAAAIAAELGRTLKPDQFPDRGMYYRSDQFNLAKIGVPAMYLSAGTQFVGRPEGWGAARIEEYTARDYHQPSDELTPAWSFDGMIADAHFGFYAGVAVANADELPQWNPGDEFEAARKAAIAAAE